MADAVSEQILWAVTKVINGLPIDPKPAAPGVRVRKQLRLLDGDGPGPFVFVAVNDGDRAEPLASGRTRGKVQWLVTYTASVALAARSKGGQGDTPFLRAWGDLIWPAVGDPKTLKAAGLAGANNSAPTGKSAFDPGALDKAADWFVKSFAVELLLER